MATNGVSSVKLDRTARAAQTENRAQITKPAQKREVVEAKRSANDDGQAVVRKPDRGIDQSPPQPKPRPKAAPEEHKEAAPPPAPSSSDANQAVSVTPEKPDTAKTALSTSSAESAVPASTTTSSSNVSSKPAPAERAQPEIKQELVPTPKEDSAPAKKDDSASSAVSAKSSSLPAQGAPSREQQLQEQAVSTNAVLK